MATIYISPIIWVTGICAILTVSPIFFYFGNIVSIEIFVATDPFTTFQKIIQLIYS